MEKWKRILTGALAGTMIGNAAPHKAENVSPPPEKTENIKSEKDFQLIMKNSHNYQEFNENLEKIKKKMSNEKKIVFLKNLAHDLGLKYDDEMQENKSYEEISDEEMFQAIKDPDSTKTTGVCSNIHSFTTKVAKKIGLDAVEKSGIWKGGNHAYTIVKIPKQNSEKNKYILINYGHSYNIGNNAKTAAELAEKKFNLATQTFDDQTTFYDKNGNEIDVAGTTSFTQDFLREVVDTNVNFDDFFEQERNVKEVKAEINDNFYLKTTYGKDIETEAGLAAIGYETGNWNEEGSGLKKEINLEAGIFKYNDEINAFLKTEAGLKLVQDFEKTKLEIGAIANMAASYNLSGGNGYIDGFLALKVFTDFEYKIDKNSEINLDLRSNYRLRAPRGNQFDLYMNWEQTMLSMKYAKNFSETGKFFWQGEIGKNKMGWIYASKIGIEQGPFYASIGVKKGTDEYKNNYTKYSGVVKYKTGDIDLFGKGIIYNENGGGSHSRINVGFNYKF